MVGAKQSVRCGAFVLVALVAFALMPTTAAAQWGWSSGSSGTWPFGDGAVRVQRSAATPARATQAAAPSEPQAARPFSFFSLFPWLRQPEAPPAAPAVAYCVRLCDGRFFPLTPTANMTPVKLCSALCPASRTKVFEGASLEAATTPEGARYEALPTAYLFRKELVPDCTCNGKNPLGLAKIDLSADPTLQAGDIVATAEGLKVFNGGGNSVRHKEASFVPLQKSALVPGSMRRTLNSMKVAKEGKAPERRL